jgi:hypothetical protein
MIINVLSQVRERYLECYVVSLDAYRTTHAPSAPEILLELDREGPLAYKFYRVDMGSNASGEFDVQEVNPETHLDFEPIHEKINSVDISLAPIAWNGVELVARLKEFEPGLVEGWTLKWLDVEDLHIQDRHGLQSVIHSVVKPELEGNALHLSIDFGSAPIDSLKELLAILEGMGAAQVHISSSCI